MRASILLAFVLLALPLAAAHEDDRVFRLELPAGASTGPIEFHLHADTRLLGIGAGGCSALAAGALRIATPTGGTIEVTYRGVNGCSVAATNALGESPERLAAGNYVGAYAFELEAPGVIEVYGEH